MNYDYEGIEAGYYDFKSPGLRKRWHAAKFKSVEKLVALHKPEIVIDIGCGPGVFLRDYCNEAELKIGFDISRVQIEYAKQFERGNLRYINSLREIASLLLDAPVRVSRVVITSIELIEHIDDETLSDLCYQIAKCLSVFDHLEVFWIFTTPNKKSLWPGLERIVDFVLGTNYRIQHSNLNDRIELEDRLHRIFDTKVRVRAFMSIFQWLLIKPPFGLRDRFFWRGLILIATFNGLGKPKK